MLLVRRWICRDDQRPMRRWHGLNDLSASCCNSRAWLALRHIETEGNTAPTATDQKRVLLP